MREIKFRGETLRGEFVYGDVLHQHMKTLIFYGAYYQVKPETVKQLIATDNNNREIYEDDPLMYLGTSIAKKASFRDYAAIEDGLAVRMVRRPNDAG